MEIVNNEAYVSLEVAKLLKKAGFDWETFSHWTESDINNPNFKFSGLSDKPILYDSYTPMDEEAYIGRKKDWNNYNNECPLIYNYSAPTIDTAREWLRKVKLVSVEINVVRWFNRYQTNEWTIFWKYIIVSIDTSSQEAIYRIVDIDNGLEFNTCEEASEAGVKKALEIITSKQWKSLVKETV